MKINEYGFVRVAAASPKVKVADCDYNVSEIIDDRCCRKRELPIVCFPELSITSYTCGDLFFQPLCSKGVEASRAVRLHKEEALAHRHCGTSVAAKKQLVQCGCGYFTRRGIGFCPQNVYSQQQRVLRETMVCGKPLPERFFCRDQWGKHTCLFRRDDFSHAVRVFRNRDL